MKKVVLRGPSLTQSGYGVHCRQIAAWLDAKPNVSVKYQVLPWGDTPWILDKNVRDGLIGRITENTVGLSVSEAERFDVSFQLQLPNEWDPTIAKFNVGMSAVVETDTCNPKWIDNCNKMDMIIVPSNHAAEVLKKTGKLQKPVVVIPESFCDEISMESSTEESQEFSTNFNFSFHIKNKSGL